MPESAATQALFDHLHEAAVVMEVTQDASDLIVVAANAAMCAQLGRSAAEVVGSSGAALYPPAAFADVLAKACATIEAGRALTYEAVRELPTGRSVVRGTMVPVAGRQLLAFGRDVSEEREAIRQRELVERSASIGSWQWNVTDDQVTWSDEYRRILGVDDRMPPDTNHLLSVMHPDDRARVQAGMDRVAGGGSASPGVRFRIRRPDGAVRTVESRGEVAHDAQGRVVRMTGTLQDVTDRVEAERRERQLADTERRRRQALEVNEDIVQGLAAAGLALQLGHIDEAVEIVARTTESAQELVASLLRQTVSGEFVAGKLVRVRASDGHRTVT